MECGGSDEEECKHFTLVTQPFLPNCCGKNIGNSGCVVGRREWGEGGEERGGREKEREKRGRENIGNSGCVFGCIRTLRVGVCVYLRVSESVGVAGIWWCIHFRICTSSEKSDCNDTRQKRKKKGNQTQKRKEARGELCGVWCVV